MCLNSSPWLGMCPFSLGLCVLSISNSSDFWDNWEGRWWKRGVSQTETQKVFVNTRCYCCSVATSCLTLCDPMDCSTPGFPVLHSLLKFAQAYAHWVNDAIQPSHSMSPPSPHAFSLCHSIRVFFNESALCIRWPKFWSCGLSISPFNEYSELISFRID